MNQGDISNSNSNNSNSNDDINIQPQPLLKSNVTRPPRSIGFLGLISIGYFLVSGGPYGIELVASTGSYVYVLLTFIFLPFIWCVPTALITAELSCMVNEDGGCSLWAQKAFGEHFSLVVGLFSWFACTVDLSLYPVLFVYYLSKLFIGTEYENCKWGGQLSDCYWCTFLISMGVIIILFLINIWGTEKVGIFGTVFSIILLVPFIIYIGMGIGKVKMGQILSVDGGIKNFTGVKWGTLITTVVWSISGYDQFGQLAGEVKNAKRNYPMGVITVMVLSICFYLLSLIVGMQFERNPNEWYTGEFSDIAISVGGKWLGILMSIGGMASSVGLFLCNLKAISNNLYSLSLRGLLPSFFSKLLPKRKTPYIATIFNSFIVSLLILFPYESILNLDMATYSIVIAFECIIYIRLYINNPDYKRPYKAIPTKWLLPYLSTPIIITIVIFVLAPKNIKWNVTVFAAAIILVVLTRYFFLKYKLKKKEKKDNNNKDLIVISYY
ncbi:hypothetical protein DICPUDRAFT_36636 [Dictyostelium purpureum]|uniref:Amino acid permease/ SLC12A domain-containing protein n=1 Tax=Dictyostelium purpureum TaxID=5786 RepID=F0ZRB9_DICPU|nr:uncharacterized protein DICPUDRAFT_36636 [Dictyostelium purpureum]EGC33488.1 hypothetical protein DICPUDRAFT_36636 [Dictyostelium purpureum]|eukprot:XP_003289962.1 hypothetical protein DICPUDRAFT_36636 [Dictyostelium purpureum]